jgi:hypothetical protein
MSFISDHARMRTYDPERNLELKYLKNMSDGTEFMELIAPDGSLPFTMSTTFEAAPTDSAGAKSIIVRHVHSRSLHSSGYSAEEKSLIEEALQAFKGMYGLHPHETVRVIFT